VGEGVEKWRNGIGHQKLYPIDFQIVTNLFENILEIVVSHYTTVLVLRQF